MLLSVVIPAFNVERYIVSSIRSALSQTFQDLEVIVVDDGSTDSTAVRAASMKDGRLKIIQQRNAGPAAARNTGIKAADGKYIALLDADDVWFPQKIEHQILFLKRNPSVGIAYTYSAYINEDGKYSGQLWMVKGKELTFRQQIFHNRICTSSAVIRKDCFLQAGLFNETLRACQDYELWVRILYKTKYKACLVPQVLTASRVRDNSIQADYDLVWQNAQLMLEIFESYIPEFTPRMKSRAKATILSTIGRRALSGGNPELAKSLIYLALGEYPALFCQDLSGLVTLLIILLQNMLPQKRREIPYQLVRRFLRAFYKIAYPNDIKFSLPTED